MTDSTEGRMSVDDIVLFTDSGLKIQELPNKIT